METPLLRRGLPFRTREDGCMTGGVRVLQLGSPIGLYGAERWILALLRHLDRQKIQSWVGSIKDEPGVEAPLCREAEKMGIPARVFESPGRLAWKAVRQLSHFIREQDIRILHTHGYKTDLLGRLAVVGTGCRIITTPHGWTERPDIKLRCYEMLDRMLMPFLDAVVPLSDELYRQLNAIPGLGGKLHLIRNGVDISEIDAVQGISPEMASWKKDGAYVIGYIGRLIPGKGIDVLFDAVARDGDRNWRVALIGEGEQAAELKDLAKRLGIERKVQFFGYREDRLEFLKGFDVFVLPSRSEGVPRCLMEAMAAGVPVVASDIPGCRYLVEHGRTGLLFPTDDPGRLYETIDSLAQDTSLSRSLVRYARLFLQERFSAARMAHEYQALYVQLSDMHHDCL